ncbi:MAG: TIGR01777 family oxidoreductase [Bacteriovorax sp.]|jgi:hypothetical protein
MKILITGATGFVGKSLTENLLALGHDIHVLSRSVEKAKSVFPQSNVSAFEWRNNLELPPAEALNGINGVINLMGENIGAKRWSKEQKKKLKESRVDATANLVRQINNTIPSGIDFFISAGAVGIYPVNKNKLLDENSQLGDTFLAKLCKLWEASTEGIKSKRKIIIRTGVVLEKDGGALKKMLLPFKLGLGGPIGDGNQMMSWIHRQDLVNIYTNAALDERYNGIFNGTTHAPVNNFDFTKALGHALHRPTIFPIPALPLKLAFGEMSTIILDSQTVISKRLPEVGYKYKFETISNALDAIFAKSQSEQGRLQERHIFRRA